VNSLIVIALTLACGCAYATESGYVLDYFNHTIKREEAVLVDQDVARRIECELYCPRTNHSHVYSYSEEAVYVYVAKKTLDEYENKEVSMPLGECLKCGKPIRKDCRRRLCSDCRCINYRSQPLERYVVHLEPNGRDGEYQAIAD